MRCELPTNNELSTFDSVCKCTRAPIRAVWSRQFTIFMSDCLACSFPNCSECDAAMTKMVRETWAKKKARTRKKIVVEDWRSARKAGSLVHACSGGMPVCKWRQSPTKGFFKQEPYCFASPAEAFLERSLCRGCQLQLPQDVSKEIAPFL